MQCWRTRARTPPDTGEELTPRPDPHGPDAVDLQLVTLRDSVTTAKRAVRYWSGELQRRIEELQSLDGVVSSMFSMLMGTRESQLDASEASVREAQARLAKARAQVAAAEAALASGEQRRAVEADRRVERIGALELLADAIRGSSHPAADRLDLLEAEIEHLRSGLDAFGEAMQAGGSLRAALGLFEMGRLAQDTRSVLSLSSSTMLSHAARIRQERDETSKIEAAIARIQPFEAACAALGVELILDKDLSRNRDADLAVDLVSEQLIGLPIAHLYGLGQLEEKIASMREIVTMTLEGLSAQRTQVIDRLRSLEAERTELLSGFEGG